MKIGRSPIRIILFTTGLAASITLMLYFYIAIPRPIGNIQVENVSIVSGSIIDGLEGANHFESDRPSEMLRIELSSMEDLLARAESVGGSDTLYAWSNACPFREPYGDPGNTRGPYPNDKSVFFEGGGLRHAIPLANGRYLYTVYVDANRVGSIGYDLCLKIRSTWYFSPHVESEVIKVSASAIARAVGR